MNNLILIFFSELIKQKKKRKKGKNSLENTKNMKVMGHYFSFNGFFKEIDGKMSRLFLKEMFIFFINMVEYSKKNISIKLFTK